MSMSFIKILKQNEDSQIEKLRRLRSGKWKALLYVLHLPLGLLCLTVSIALLIAATIGAIVLGVCLFEQRYDHVVDLTLVVFGGGLLGWVVAHGSARVMYHVLRK